MMALTSQLFGVYDINTLATIFALNAVMCLFGLLFEVMNSNLRRAGDSTVDW